MRKPPRPESFEKFYYTKVGLGEACGCAEKIIDVYEFNRLAGQHYLKGGIRTGSFRKVLRRLAAKLRVPGLRAQDTAR